MRLIMAVSAIVALAAAACGGSSSSSSTSTPAAAPTTAASAVAAGTPSPSACANAASGVSTQPAPAGTQTGGRKTYTAAPPMTIDVNKTYCAIIEMDIGNITLELFARDAPVTVNSFLFLARDHFYDGVTFHRVIPGFVAQAGDPTGTGSGGPGYTIKDEVNSHKFLDGTVGMAKTSAPNSGGSQFFIDYAPQPALDGGYTVFGQVVAGRDVLDKIAPRNPASATTPGTKINTIVIVEK
ncbi:MAG TPA: peptidylprolyl isomerase [Dehalococcoidia bacterium]|nr:peptidylprolyl isomerase [Dehalococcoidia bacterium]